MGYSPKVGPRGLSEKLSQDVKTLIRSRLGVPEEPDMIQAHRQEEGDLWCSASDWV